MDRLGIGVGIVGICVEQNGWFFVVPLFTAYKTTYRGDELAGQKN